jgi:site-specific recombinase XerC
MTGQEPKPVDAALSVLKERLDARSLCTALQECLEAALPESSRSSRTARLDYDEMTRAVNFFGQFLGEQPGLADANEAALAQFKSWIEKQGYKLNTVFALVRHVRNLINGLPAAMLTRPLLDDKAYAKATRLDGLTPDSKALLADYQRNGCRLRNGRLSTTLLKETCRENAVGAVLRLLNAAGKKDLFEITVEDAERFLEQYSEDGRRNSGIDQLATARQFFAILVAKKRMASNPLDRFTGKTGKVDGDFVPRDGIVKLQDLASLNLNHFEDVRNRLLAFTICYDFALRVGEAAQLLVSDLKISDFVELTVRSEIQKGTNKPKAYSSSFFPESRTLMTTYLKLRSGLNPQTDTLLLSYNGKPLGESGCRDAVAKHCLALGIKTEEGRRPNPHRLRHSFGTLNAKPVGLDLDVYEIMQRLRHADLKTTIQIYITNNPVLQRERHAAVVARKTKPVSAPYHPAPERIMPLEIEFVAEWEVLNRMREKKLNLTWQGLREFCSTRKLCHQNGDGWVYSKAFIMDLTQNWATKREAIAALNLGNSGFYYWVKAHGINLISIGKVTFIKWDDIRKAIHEKVA